MRPKKSPLFILVEESGKILQIQKKKNSENYSPKGSRRQNHFFQLCNKDANIKDNIFEILSQNSEIASQYSVILAIFGSFGFLAACIFFGTPYWGGFYIFLTLSKGGVKPMFKKFCCRFCTILEAIWQYNPQSASKFDCS